MKNRRLLLSAALITAATLILPRPGVSQTVRDIYAFDGQNSSGDPYSTPTQGRDGRLYGTSPSPQSSGGSDFSLSLGGSINVIHTFTSTATGIGPEAGLTLGTDGNYYGAATGGGTANWGLLYSLSAHGTFTILHSFLAGTDGSAPFSAPILGTDGKFYGTTAGTTVTPPTVYKYDPSSGTLTTLYVFDFFHGNEVYAGLLQASDGYLYGTAWMGGHHDYGTIFKLDTSGKLFFSYSFPGGAGGQNPNGPLIEANDGNLYGTAALGGLPLQQGYGTIFKMTKSGVVTTLYSFDPKKGGYDPLGGLIQGTDGYLYGCLTLSRPDQASLYRISLSGQYEDVYLMPQSVGTSLASPPMQDTNGLFYGSAPYGGPLGFGAIYSLDMGLAPFVTFVQATGKAGKSAQILGQKLTGTTAVTFNGLPATSFKVVSDTYMTAVVPTGATTGPVVVTTPSGPLPSNKHFTVLK